LVTAGAAAQAGKAQPVGRSGPINYFKNTARLTVDTVTLGFVPAGRVLSSPATRGAQFLRVGVTIANTGTSVYTVYFTNLLLETSDKTRHDVTLLINKGNSTDRLATTKLDPGGTLTGALYFEVPATETAETMSMVYKGHVDGEDKFFVFPLTPASAAPAGDPPKGLDQPGADLTAAPGTSLEGAWVMDEAKSKAATDGNTAGLMKRVEMAGDGTFTAGAGVTGKYTFDGTTLVVFYSNSPGLAKKGGIDGEWLKFPAPAGLNRFVYMKRPG
jgi:hypothetical protein